MKTFHPLQRTNNLRVFTSLLVAFFLLVTPVVPAATGTALASFNPAFAPATTVVSATKADSWDDSATPDGKAEPGETLTYDVNVSNTGAADATGVTFTDTIDPNTTLVPGSLRVSPLAFADSYSAAKDTALNVPAPGLLANDTGTPAPTAQPISSGPTSGGGTVTLLADGSFNYTPATGFQGADTFTYTATNGLTPNDSATVTINVDDGPVVTATSPANGATGVAQNTNITVTFSESVNATAGSFSVECPAGSPQTFTLSASPSASFTLDPSADLPAGTTCTVKVFAAGITDADTFDPPDNMAADHTFSFGVKPLAVDDMRSATGNVKIDTATTGYSVLANDQGSGLAITAFDATSASGGEVTMNTTTGTFTYNPPRGFTGTDSFNYTINSSDTGTVVLTVTDRVWFINNASGACSSGCDGRLTNPYTTLAAFEADNGGGGSHPAAGDSIFLYTGGGDYTGPLTLENDQKLVGQGATSSLATLAGITFAADSVGLPSTGGTSPAITSASTGITVAQNDAIHGLSVVNTTGTGISGTNFVALTVSENVIVSNTTTPGVAVSLTNGALTASFKSISAGNNDATPDPANGIVLTDTTGTFAVTGGGNTSQGGDNSGGTIRNTSGDAVSLSNADGVSLNNMNIQSPAGNGVKGTNGVSDFSFTYGKINDAGDATGEGCANFSTAGAVNATGTFTFTNSQCTQTEGDGIHIANYGGTLSDVNISNNLINDTGALTTPGSAVLLIVNSTAASSAVLTKASLDNNSIFDFRAGGGFVLQGNSDLGGTNTVTYGTANSATNVVSVKGNLFNGGNGGVSNQPDRFVTGALSGRGTAAYDVSNNGTAANPIQKIDGVGIELSNFGPGTMSANVNDNRLAVNNGVGAAGMGVGCDADGDSTTADNGTFTLVVDGNNVSQTDGPGIFAIARNSQCVLNTRITDNTVAAPTTTTAARAGIRVDSGSTAGDTNLCLDLRNNTTAGSTSSTGTKSPGINIRKQGTNATINDYGIEGLTTSPATGAQASTYVSSQNPGSASGTFGTGGAASLSGANYVSCSTAPDETSFFRTEPGQRADDLAFFMNPFGDAPSAPTSAAAAQAAPLPAGVTSKGERSLAGGKLELPTSKRKAGMALRHTASDSSAPLAETPRAAAAAPVVQPFSGETVTATIGTLPAGKTVHIQFQVTVNNPFMGATPQVSNKGMVSGDNFTTTDTNTAVTPILTPPSISVKDATVAEPATGSATAAFAVTLSHSYTHTVTVDFTTADGGASAGSDYTTTSGTLTFSPGQTVQTVSVPVLADGDASEADETFFVNLSNNSANSSIADGQATGTIKPEGTPGTLIISELRTSGPGGPDDDFVELYNNTDSPITVAAADASAGWALVKSGAACTDTPVVIAVIPAGTVIPARGNYLLVGSAYSLNNYGGTNAAAGDQGLVFNIENDRNVALFNTSDLSNISTAGRLDAVGFGTNTGGNCDLLREGATLQPAAGSASEYSFVRKVDKGATADTNDNASDFIVVSTTTGAVGANATPKLGAPGPENSTGARGPVPCNVPDTAKFGRARLDPAAALGSAPNTARDTNPGDPNTSNFGTIDFRRTFTNNTGGNVTQLRFRVTNVKNPPAPGTADLRALTSLDTVVTTSGGPVTVRGTTLEQPPGQPSGGSINSSLGVGTITLATPLAPGASVNLHLLFGVQQAGDYHLSMVVETATGGQIGQDVWELRGNTENGTSNEGGCNTPPVANAGADQTIECGGAMTPVSLDGSLSTDADGDTLTYEWREGATVLGATAVLNKSLPFGPHTITLKVTDPSGDFSEDTVSVDIVDNTDPLIDAPDNVTVYTGPGANSCDAFVSDATLGAATASDGCNPVVTINRTGVPSGNTFPVGTTIITYTADDGHGNTASDQQVVTVIDNTAPTVTAPANIEVNAPPNTCEVNLNPGAPTVGDNCPGVTYAGVRSDNQPLNAPYQVGITYITWTATDASTDALNNTATAVQTVKVNDATPPVINLTTGVINLSPPNHQYQTFSVSNFVASVSDGCDASVDINDVVISQATSDEEENAVGNGDGNTVNDIVIAPDCKSLQLRSERAGGGDGRVYTITLKVKDAGGNVATAVRKVFVPRTGPAVDSGVNYTVNGCLP